MGNPILTGSNHEKHASNQLDITSETSEFDKTWVPRGILQGITVWANVGFPVVKKFFTSTDCPSPLGSLFSMPNPDGQKNNNKILWL